MNEDKKICMCFIELDCVLDNSERVDIWKTLGKRNTQKKPIEIIETMYTNNVNVAKTNIDRFKQFTT